MAGQSDIGYSVSCSCLARGRPILNYAAGSQNNNNNNPYLKLEALCAGCLDNHHVLHGPPPGLV